MPRRDVSVVEAEKGVRHDGVIYELRGHRRGLFEGDLPVQTVPVFGGAEPAFVASRDVEEHGIPGFFRGAPVLFGDDDGVQQSRDGDGRADGGVGGIGGAEDIAVDLIRKGGEEIRDSRRFAPDAVRGLRAPLLSDKGEVEIGRAVLDEDLGVRGPGGKSFEGGEGELVAVIRRFGDGDDGLRLHALRENAGFGGRFGFGLRLRFRIHRLFRLRGGIRCFGRDLRGIIPGTLSVRIRRGGSAGGEGAQKDGGQKGGKETNASIPHGGASSDFLSVRPGTF